MHAGAVLKEVVKIMQYHKPLTETYDAGKEYLHENKLEGLEDLLTSISEKEYGISRDDVKIIYSGNAEFPHDEREQWTDACNLLAIKDSVVIGYARNERTAKAFEEHLNYKVIKSRYLIQQFESGEVSPESLEKTLILLPSSELSRARGGSHCMSLPLMRDEVFR
jgi:arginine deiminase